MPVRLRDDAEPPRRWRSVVWGVSLMVVGAAAAAGVFLVLSHVRGQATAAPVVAADPPPAVATATATVHEPAVALGAARRPQVVTFDDALAIDSDLAPAASASASASASTPPPVARRGVVRTKNVTKEVPPTSPDVLGAALSGSDAPAPVTKTTPAATTAAVPPPPPAPPATQEEKPRAPRTPMEALADAQLKATMK
jgi:hypothetical protein